MPSFLQRLTGRPTSSGAADAEVQLRVLVAMAAVDGRIEEVETDQIADFIDRAARSDREHRRLYALLDELLAAPPGIEALLVDLERHADARRVGARLAHELAHVAWSDHTVDHREEFLLDLVCGVFGLPPVELHAGDAGDDLADLHRVLQRVSRRAA
ncbi:MAG: Tellurite resistance protein TerB [Thermoleophilia bacterium]|nr:Tellurite resistance protein TerB [Thermoleophilia bacterium]